MLASAARQFPLLCLLVFGVTSAPPEWLKIREDVQEITPWNSSTVTSTEPLTWRIAEGDEFFSLLELDDYQQYLWTAMNGTTSLEDKTNWTPCAPCVDVHRITQTFQFRYQYSDAEAESIDVRMCNTSACPAIRHRGYWYYDWILNDELVKIQRLERNFNISITSPQHRQLPFYVRHCSVETQRLGLKFTILTRDNCYGSNSTVVLRRGVKTDVNTANDNWMEIFIFQECPAPCRLITSQDICICGGSSTPLNLAASVALCEANNSIIYPLNQVEIILEAGNVSDVEESTLVVRDFSDSQQYSCIYLSNTSKPCNVSALHVSLCIFNDSNQFDWLEPPVTSSCTEACGTGNLTTTYYKLIPPAYSDMWYRPQSVQIMTYCNTDACPWDSNGAMLSHLYPKWNGCWEGTSLSPQLFTNSSVLDGDSISRLAYVEKCALATHSNYTHFAVKQRLCYTVTSTDTAYTEPSSQCASFYNTEEAFDVYTYSAGALPGRWGVWVALNNCTHACNSGTDKTERECNNPPDTGAEFTHCNGNSIKYYYCNTDPCPSPFDYSSIGCYDVSEVSLHIYTDDRLDGYIPYKRNDPVRKCAFVANQRDHAMFGLAYGGHCIKIDEDLKCRLKKLPISSECQQDIGGDNSMSLLSFTPDQPLTFESCKMPSTTSPPETSTQSEGRDQNNKDTISPEEAMDMMNTLMDTLNSLTVFTKDTIVEITDTFDLISQQLNVNSTLDSEVFIGSITQTLNLITQEQHASVWKETGLFTSLLTAVETIAIKLSAIASNSSNVEMGKVYISIQPLQPVNNSAEKSAVSFDYQDIAVQLSTEIVQSTDDTSVPAGFVVYSEIANFIGGSAFESELGLEGADLLFADDIITLKVGVEPSTIWLNEGIKINIPFDKAEQEAKYTETKQVEPVCVFWNDTSSLWSSEGCKTELDGKEVQCICNHLTSFAVLLRVTDYEPEQKVSSALAIISYIGCAISLLCLVISFAIFVYLDNLKTERKKIHMNLIVALGLAQLTHIVGIDLTYDQSTCKSMAILLHFLYLATFTWMLCEGIHLYHKVISVFESEGKWKTVMYYVIGWGVPVLIVSISVGVRFDSYGSDKFCWLSISDGLIAAFVGPVCAVIILNFIIMAIVIRIVIKSASSVAPAEQKKLHAAKAGVKSVLILTPILGVNWVFGLLAVNEDLLVFEFLFVIVNSLQGLFIFLFHCVGSSEVRYAFSRKRELASRSIDRSLDYKDQLSKEKRASAAWQPKILKSVLTEKDGKFEQSIETSDSSGADIADGIISGTMGRNVGGLRHVVKRHSGLTNHAFHGSTISSLSPHSDSYLGEDNESIAYSTRLSNLTVSTVLSDDSQKSNRPTSSNSGRSSVLSVRRKSDSHSIFDTHNSVHPMVVGLEKTLVPYYYNVPTPKEEPANLEKIEESGLP